MSNINKLNIDGILYSFSSEYTPPIYSTEKWIPTNETWIDGKKIYQKVLTKKDFNGITTINTENIDTFITYTGWIKRTSDGRKDVIPWILYSNEYGKSTITLCYNTNESKKIDIFIYVNGEVVRTFTDCEIIIKATLIDDT